MILQDSTGKACKKTWKTKQFRQYPGNRNTKQQHQKAGLACAALKDPFFFRIKMRLSVIEGTNKLIDLINPDRPEVCSVEDPLLGPIVSRSKFKLSATKVFFVKE